MTILQRILATKRNEVDRVRRERPLPVVELEARTQPPPRDFYGAVTAEDPSAPNLIAEIKHKSPSAGVIVPDLDPPVIARMYARSGAAAISVLTDRTYFGGDIRHLQAVRRSVEVPLLRKDFVVDAYQVYEARAAGADAVLLIAEALTTSGVAMLLPVIRELGMTPLLEVHSADVLGRVLDGIGPPGSDRYLLGMNNRDLATQKTDLDTMQRLAARLPPGTPFVAESGIETRADVLKARQAGAAAMLIGESILRAPDMAAKIAALLGRA